MSSINPPDEPGYTQMYTFGVKVIRNPGVYEYLIITVRGPTEKMAKAHVESIFHGNYRDKALVLYNDLDEWKREAKPDPYGGE